MIAINRFRVEQTAEREFLTRAETALAVLADRPGWDGGDLVRNVDDPQLWTLITRWSGVGAYRRALGSYQAKISVAPLLGSAIDEPSAYVGLDELSSIDPDR